MSEDWPLGEAFKIAYESKTAVLWQVGAVGAVDDSLVSPKHNTPLPPPPKRPRTERSSGMQTDLSTGKPVSLKDLCEKGQCARKQAECPDKKLH
eukprot:s445_g23.t1